MDKKVTELVDHHDSNFKKKKVQFDKFSLEDETIRTQSKPRVIRKFQFPEDLETALCDVTEHGVTCSEEKSASTGFRLAI